MIDGGVVLLGLCRVTREKSVLKGNVAASVFLSVHWASDSEGANDCQETGSGAGLYPLPHCMIPKKLSLFSAGALCGIQP